MEQMRVASAIVLFLALASWVLALGEPHALHLPVGAWAQPAHRTLPPTFPGTLNPARPPAPTPSHPRRPGLHQLQHVPRRSQRPAAHRQVLAHVELVRGLGLRCMPVSATTYVPDRRARPLPARPPNFCRNTHTARALLPLALLPPRREWWCLFLELFVILAAAITTLMPIQRLARGRHVLAHFFTIATVIIMTALSANLNTYVWCAGSARACARHRAARGRGQLRTYRSASADCLCHHSLQTLVDLLLLPFEQPWTPPPSAHPSQAVPRRVPALQQLPGR